MTKQVTYRKANKNIDTQEEIVEIIKMWADYGYEKAELVPAYNFRRSRDAKKPVFTKDKMNLVLDGEASEIVYIWVEDNGEYRLDAEHHYEYDERFEADYRIW